MNTMSSEHEKRLEIEMDQELKRLPELEAPRTLAPRVLAAIAWRASVPWHRRAWETWPIAVRTAAVLVLLALFGGLCFAGWELPHSGVFAAVASEISHLGSGLNTFWNTANDLAGAAVTVAKHIGTGLVIALFAAMGLGYAMLLGLGTFYVRLAVAHR
jgi:hypothetical protein